FFLKANTLGETGVLTGNSTCTTLGDPSKGIYISMYSDCLDLNRWYHGKSGYIAILKLTKGRVKKTLENYTQTFTVPTVGFDCHVSEQLPSVSDKTSSFLAFERTQYYMYELLDDGSSETSPSPSAACPYAIVSFSYTDTKATPVAPHQERGQLQIVDQFYDVRLRSTTGALIPAELPPVVKVDRAISMLDLRQRLPGAVFETCSLSGEGAAVLDNLKKKKKNYSQELYFLHISYTKCGHRNPTIPPEILRFLPVLSYAEGEVEKTPIDPTLVNPGLDLIPSREVGIFADQYDVPGAHKHLYASPEWTNRAWQSLQSYLSKPASFQIPVAKASEILVVGQENQVEDLDDDLYICLSSPEEVPTNAAGTGSEDQLSGQESCMNVGTSETSVEAPVDLRVYPQNVEADDLQVKGSDKDTEQSELRELIKTDMRTKSLLIPSASDELPAELIVSITSAEQTDESVISAESAKLNDLQISDFSTAKSQTTEVNTLNDDTVRAKKLLDAPEVNSLPKMKFIKVRRGPAKGRKKVSNTWIKTPSLPTEEMSVESDNSTSLKDNLAKESVDHQQSSKPTITDWRKARRRKRVFGKLSQRNKKVRSCTVGPSFAEEKKTDPVQQHLMELEAFPLRRKTERWDLKPVVSECGRILVPHGSVDITDKIKSLKDKLQSSTNEQEVEKMLVVASEESPDAIEMEQKASTAPETALAKIETTAFRNGGDHLKNDTVSPVSPKHSISRPLDAGNDSSNINLESAVLLSKSHDTSPLEVVQKNPSHVVTTGKSQTKAEFLLSKLKSVLLRGKRKMGPLALENMTDCTAQAAEPCLKMSKVEPETGILKSNETDLGFKEVSKVERHNDKECTRDNSVKKTVVEKLNSACSSTDALNLLADLALSASHDEVPPQPTQALGTQPETSLKKCDLTKDVTSVDQESVLHALLRQPAARPIQTLDSPSPSHLVECSELVGLVSKEHAYSLPPSSSLPLGLPGTPFQVSPLSGSSGLLQHQRTMYEDGSRAFNPSAIQKDKVEQVYRTQDDLKKHLMRRRKFRHSRTFVNMNESVQVTKQWKENYDFNLDSKFASDSKDGAIIRALHGPWDYSVQDSSEELRLIVHMWIGLFYSRSTPRLFHIDSDSTLPCSEESDSLEMSSELVSRITLDHGSMILDLSVKNSNAEVVTSDSQVTSNKDPDASSEWKGASKTLNTQSSKGQQEASPSKVCFNCYYYIKDKIVCIWRVAIFKWFGIQSMLLLSNYLKSNGGTWFTGDGVPTFQPNEIEPKYGEELEVKGKLHQDDNHEPYPKRIQEGGDTTIKDLAVVCHENLMENEKRLSSEGPMAVSESKAVNVNEDVDCCAINESKVITEDHFGEDDRLVEKDSSVSAVDTESDEKNHPLSVMCNGQDFVKKDDITKHTCPEHLDEQLPQAENKESFHDLQLRKLCANGRDEHTIPQGCYNGKTDVKDDTGNSEATEIRLVQPLERVLSKSMMDDSNKEVGGGVPTFQPNEIEPKYGEELEVKGKLHQDDNHELYPKRIQEGGDTTIKDLAVVCHENLMENEKRLSSEGPMAVSESKAVNVNEDVDCCAINESKVIKEDHFGEDDRLVEKDSSVSAVDTESDEKNHPLSVMCNGQDFVKKDDITKHTCPEHLDEQLPQAENKQLFNDLQLRKLCANGRDKHAIPEKGPHSSSNMEAKCNEPAVKENAENDICTAAKATKNESTCSLDGSNARNCIPQTNNRVASGNKNKAMASFNLRSDDHKHWDTKSVQMVDNTTDKELSLHLSHSPKCEQIQLEAEVTKEMDQRSGKTNEGLEECNGRVVIPFIGIDISREDIVLPHDSQSQDCNCKKADVSTGKVSLLDIPENKPWAFGGWSDDRCPTPTMDEKPYESITSSDPQSYPSSTFLTQKCLNGSSVTGKDKVPIEQKPCQKSTVNGDSDPHHGLHPDLELRTLRVFQSIDQFLSKSELKIIHKKSAPVSSSSVQKVHTESSAHFLISPFKSKIEEVLGVGLQLKKTDSSVRQQYFEGTEKSQESSSGQGYCHPHHSLSSTSTLGAIISNVDQDTATSQANLSHEPCSSSLRPVMAVKPSKSDESQADSLSKDRQIDHSVMSKFAKNKQPKIPLVTSPTRTTMLLEKQRECYKGTSEGINNNAQEASKLLEKSSWSPHVGDRKSKYDKDTLVCQDPLYQNKRRDSSKYNKISSSSLPVQTFGCIKSSSQLVNGKHGFSTNSSADRVGQTAAESLDMDQNDCLSASTSLVDYKDDNNIDDSLYLGPDSSLSCTVYNTSQKRSHSFLEQISQRCIQEDPTEASMEQECLIFSEKIKQLLKRSKKGSIHQPESHGKLNLPCPSPMTVHFSGLEEQEETMDHLDAPSLFGQKIKVHMSDREDLEATTEGEKALHSKKSSEGTGTPIEDAGVSTVTAECAELYEEKMNNICAVRKVPSTRKHMERGCPRSEPSKYFDFCDQMKREMDNSFRSNLNSVVKKSRKTKYRFYILETSDDVFFEETKLEAEGHTAVQPSEFFLDKGTSSSLLIILRNEDIAEHICEVPHLLALKKSPGVQFAGIDETDDVVNLTHQELFTKGGFIMLDGAALEPLSLCDMKKMSEILQGLSKTGKWKWMLHYRDSRRLKENARLSQEAKEKKQLLNWCQEAGIIEVLPYHECDLMSRDQPDYLTCLVRLQVQNISARYTVFITGETIQHEYTFTINYSPDILIFGMQLRDSKY
uniref:Uncharacterized protein n=1 Tax=Labrus bergylta TaxID=56723 RepID=A0A3Q3LYG5_9LABR